MHVKAACMLRLQVVILRMGSRGNPHTRLKMPPLQGNCGLSVVSLQECRTTLQSSSIMSTSKARDKADSSSMPCCYQSLCTESGSPLEATVYGAHTSCEILV